MSVRLLIFSLVFLVIVALTLWVISHGDAVDSILQAMIWAYIAYTITDPDSRIRQWILDL